MYKDPEFEKVVKEFLESKHAKLGCKELKDIVRKKLDIAFRCGYSSGLARARKILKD